jgi:hypothetical protein
VAGTLDTLLGRLVRQFITSSRRDGQDSFLPGLLVVFGFVTFVGRFFLRIAGAFLAALVVALLAHSLGAIEGTATVTAAVDAHADGFFYTRHQRSWGWGRNPFVGVEGQAIFGEEGTGAFLLHGIAVEGGGCDWSRGLNHGDGSKVFQSSGSGVVSYGGKEVAIVDNVRSGSGFFADNVGGVGGRFGGVRSQIGDVVLGGGLWG